MGSIEENQSNNNPGPSTSPLELDLALISERQDIFCFLKKEERHLFSPSFFSQNGLSQDIIKVTDAEPDICLEVFYALYHALWPQIEKQSSVSLKDAWNNFIGGSIFKGILYPPEKLIGKKKTKDMKRILSENQGEHQVFQDLDRVIKSIFDLKQKILDYPDQLLLKEEILESLDLVEGFYQEYRNRVKALGQAILQASSVSEYDTLMDALVDLLEPKAVMMGEIFTGHWAYRIPRNKAQKMLSLDENRRPIESDSNEPSSHRVAALPEKSEAPEPLVYFKANGGTAIQPEKEFTLYSLYKHLKIPVPETALLILTDVYENNSDYYYAVQASEAVNGKSAREALKDQKTIFQEEAYVKQVVGALLTNPSDGSFNNFKYSSKYETLISIDNDLIFEPELTGNQVKTANVKSILYILHLMDKPIPVSIQTYFTTLDSHLIMFAWLKDLGQKNKEYILLFARLSFQKTRYIYQNLLPHSEIPSLSKNIQQNIQVDPDLENSSFSPLILISKKLLDNVSEKLQIIQKTFLNNRSLSSQILLEEISSILGKYYHELRLEFSDPEEALDILWGGKKGIPFNSEEFGSSRHKKNASDENLPPDMFFEDYKSKLISGERPPFDKFIQRHSQRKMKKLLDLSQVVEELRFLKREGLTDSQSLRDVVDFCYAISKMTDVEDHLRKEIALLFSSLPNAELKWLLTLEKYFLRTDYDVSENMKPSSIAINGAFLRQRMFILTESAKQEIFDEQGNIKKDTSLTGRSNVTGFPKNNPEFYLKQYPEWPGYEFANILFMRLMGVSQLPYQDLLIMERNSSYPVLLTQKGNGDPVFQVWQDPKAFNNLDPFHTGLLIIAAMLLNPEDGKEDNFLLSKDGKYLIPIDNDHCFLPSTFQKGAFWNIFVNTALQTKTLLFCLDEMNKPVPDEVKQHILSINFDLLLKSWMKELIKIEDRYSYLVDQEQRNLFLENGTVLRIPFYEQFIHNLYWKVNKIQDLLRSPLEQTPFSLLRAMEPFVARCYQDSFQHGDTLQSRFKAATNQLYLDTKNNKSRVSVLNTRSIMNIINVSEKDLQNDITYHKRGPSDALELLEQLMGEQKEKRKMEQDLLCELDDKNEESIWTTLFGTPLLEASLNNFFANPGEGLALKGSKLITSSKLTGLFAQTPDQGIKIKFLSLPNSPLLDSKTIQTLVEGCPNLEYLNASGCVKLEEIVTVKGEWSFLTRLEAKDCLNFKRLGSCSPIKILRIGTHQKIEILIEKHVLEIFTISTETNQFDFWLEKEGSFKIKSLEKSPPLVDFLQSAVFQKEMFYKYFRNPKITIGTHSILSAMDLATFLTSLHLRNSSLNHEEMNSILQFPLSSLKNLGLASCQITGTSILKSLIQGDCPKLSHLNLSSNLILDQGLLILSRGNWPLLETLNLQNTGMTSVGINTLVDRSNWPQLQSLNLSQNSGIEDEGIQKLAQGNWPLLEILDLNSINGTKKGLLNFVLNINFLSLDRIRSDLSRGEDPNSLLRNNWHLLEYLDLSYGKITQNEIEAIVLECKWPYLKDLNLSCNNIRYEGLVILSQGNWPFLKTLNLQNTGMTSGGIKTLVDQSNWPKLKYLNLSENPGINDEGLQTLAQGDWLLLKFLNLNSTKVTKRGLLDSILNQNWPSLKYFSFESEGINFAQNLLKQNWHLCKELNLHSSEIMQKEIAAVVNMFKWPNLKHLNISWNHIRDEGLVILSQGDWPLLQTLNLARIEITSMGIEAIVERSNWPNLKQLNLSCNEINDEVFEILPRGNWLQLQELNLIDTKITKKGLLNFLFDGKCSQIRELNVLFWLHAYVNFANYLIKSKPGVEKLELNNLELTEIEIDFITRKYQFERLKYLNISDSQVFDEGISMLPLSKWPLLEELNVENTKITQKGIETIVNQSKWERLKCLNISNNKLFDEGMLKLALGEWPLLEELYIKNIEITLQGIEALVDKMKLVSLKKLDLSENAIFDEGLKTLTSGKWPKFQHLVYYDTQVTFKGNISFLENSQWPNLQTLEHSLDESFYKHSENPNNRSLPEIILATAPINYQKESILMIVLDTTWLNSKEIYVSTRHNGFNEKIVIFSRDQLDQLEEIQFSPWTSPIQFIVWPSNLKKLDISNNLFSDEKDIENLFSSKCLLLEDLNLRNTKISTKGIEILISKSDWPNLKKLNISWNPIQNEGLRTLSSGNWPLLENLNLQSTNLTNEGLASMISVAKWPNLKVLDFSYNTHLSDEGYQTLASGKWSALEILNLNCTKITLENVETLIEKSSWPNLKEIYLVRKTEDDDDETNAISQLISLRWPSVKFWIDIFDAFLLDIVPPRPREVKFRRRGEKENDPSSFAKKNKSFCLREAPGFSTC